MGETRSTRQRVWLRDRQAHRQGDDLGSGSRSGQHRMTDQCDEVSRRLHGTRGALGEHQSERSPHGDPRHGDRCKFHSNTHRDTRAHRSQARALKHGVLVGDRVDGGKLGSRVNYGSRYASFRGMEHRGSLALQMALRFLHS